MGSPRPGSSLEFQPSGALTPWWPSATPTPRLAAPGQQTPSHASQWTSLRTGTASDQSHTDAGFLLDAYYRHPSSLLAIAIGHILITRVWASKMVRPGRQESDGAR